jgi:hypothetical protein
LSTNPLLEHPAMKLIEQALYREWRWKLIVYVILFVLGFGLSAIFFPTYPVLAFLSIAMTTACFLWALYLYQFRKKTFPLLHIIKQNPKQIVWVYSMVIQRMPFGFEFSQSGLIYVKLIDGNDITLSVPAEKLKLVLKYLGRLLPHIAVGYSKEREQAYRENPSNVR